MSTINARMFSGSLGVGSWSTLIPSELTPEIRCVMEIVIDGLTEADVASAMRAGLAAVTARGAAAGVLRVSAGNYGGKLGPYHFHLSKLIDGVAP